MSAHFKLSKEMITGKGKGKNCEHFSGFPVSKQNLGALVFKCMSLAG